MLDPLMRRLIDPPLEPLGGWIARRGITANQLTVAGLAIGLLAVPAVLAALAVQMARRA